MKIAWFTPFSSKAAIGHYSAAIYPELSKRASVKIFVSDALRAEETWLPKADLAFIKHLGAANIKPLLDEFDICIYNLGDHFENHGDIYFTAMQHPGITIVHDLVMNHFFSGLYFLRLNRPDGYTRELLYSHGQAGRQFGEDIISGRAKGIGKDDVWMSSRMLEFHMAKSALRGTLGVVAHSDFATREIEKFASYPVKRINFPVFVNPLPERTKIETPPNCVRMLTFGNINANKAIHLTLEAVGKSVEVKERVIYDVIGDLPDWYKVQLDPLIERYNLRDTVHFHGFVPDTVLADYMKAADIIINLRNPHFGESSASLMQSLYYGKPTIVWKHGYYDEFPDNVVLKVSDAASLQSTIARVVVDVSLRNQIGSNAKQYSHGIFSTERYCDELMAFIDQVLAAQPLYALTDFAVSILSEMGIDRRDEELLRQISDEIFALSQ